MVVCFLLVSGGCEYSFKPLKKDAESFFSIYGYLDASADTQWVRVSPTRDQLNMGDTKPEMTVTLEEVETGNITVMNDSLLKDPNGVNYLNSWTTTDIKPEHTYRLKAELPDGASSNVTATIPEDFPTPELQLFIKGCQARLDIQNVNKLADVQSIWNLRYYYSGFIEDRFYRLPYRDLVREREAGNYTVYFNAEVEYERIERKGLSGPDSLLLLQRDVFVAAGGPEWNEEISSVPDKEYALPDGFSNVENGVGYMFGIVSKTLTNEPGNLGECL